MKTEEIHKGIFEMLLPENLDVEIYYEKQLFNVIESATKLHFLSHDLKEYVIKLDNWTDEQNEFSVYFMEYERNWDKTQTEIELKNWELTLASEESVEHIKNGIKEVIMKVLKKVEEQTMKQLKTIKGAKRCLILNTQT